MLVNVQIYREGVEERKLLKSERKNLSSQKGKKICKLYAEQQTAD